MLVAAAVFAGRHFMRDAMRENLPQLDGTLTVYGLAAPVTVERDAHGVPHIRASSMDDLVFAQGFVTAQDRLWQMDLLRRHAAGELAAILGRSMLEHDRLQRTLQIRASADRAIAALPADQRHWLEVYARGVNASIAAQRAHLPVEFRLLGYQPAAWTPRDSILVELAMFQDLTTGFPEKLGREALAAHLSPDLIADLYPEGSWRDHYPGQPMPDVSAPQPEFNDIPLDESQSKLHRPSRRWTTSCGRSAGASADACPVSRALRRLCCRIERMGRLRLSHRLRKAAALQRHAPLAERSRAVVRGRSGGRKTRPAGRFPRRRSHSARHALCHRRA